MCPGHGRHLLMCMARLTLSSRSRAAEADGQSVKVHHRAQAGAGSVLGGFGEHPARVGRCELFPLCAMARDLGDVHVQLQQQAVRVDGDAVAFLDPRQGLYDAAALGLAHYAAASVPPASIDERLKTIGWKRSTPRRRSTQASASSSSMRRPSAICRSMSRAA